MTLDLLRRVRAATELRLFSLLHAPMLARCGCRSLLRRPFRVDGWERISLGEGTVIQDGGWLYCRPSGDGEAKLVVGDGCVFGYRNHIAAVGCVEIGDHVLTANNVYISDNLHAYEDVSVPIMYQPVRFKRAVTIGSGSWIGENAAIIGASVGRNCVIGANAVVTHDIPDYSVAVGVPARTIRRYDPDSGVWVTC